MFLGSHLIEDGLTNTNHLLWLCVMLVFNQIPSSYPQKQRFCRFSKDLIWLYLWLWISDLYAVLGISFLLLSILFLNWKLSIFNKFLICLLFEFISLFSFVYLGVVWLFVSKITCKWNCSVSKNAVFQLISLLFGLL